MRKYRGLHRIAGLVLVTLLVASAIAYADDEAEVNALFDRLERARTAWTRDALLECYSDQAMILTDVPRMVLFALSKQQYLDAERFETQRPAAQGARHSIRDRQISLNWDVVYVYATSVRTAADGRVSEARCLFLVRKEEGGWRIVLEVVPWTFEPATLVESVQENSEAARMGIGSGFRIVSYDGHEVRYPWDLIARLRERMQENSEGKALLGVESGDRQAELEVSPGQLGVQVVTRYYSTESDTMYDVQRHHPAKESNVRFLEAFNRNDLNAAIREIHPNGAIRFFGRDREPVRIGPGNHEESERWLAEERATYAWDGVTVECLESRALVSGKLALVGTRMRVTAPGKPDDFPTNVNLFGEWQGSWKMLFSFPSRSTDVGLQAPLVTQRKDAGQMKKLQETVKGEFVGIGVHVKKVENGILIPEVVPDGPSDKAGVQAGEIITAINAIPTAPMGLDDAVKLLKGEKGTTVEVTLSNETGTESRHVTITRDKIKLRGMNWRIDESGIGWIEIRRFQPEAADELRQALAEFRAEEVDRLVIDLRRNTGGLYPQVVEAASILIGNAQPLWYLHNIGDEELTEIRGNTAAETDLPMIVLISNSTVGGGEVLAAALRSSQRTMLVGQTTAGMAEIARWVEKPDGGGERVTTGHFLAPDDRQTIKPNGIRPDVPVSNEAPLEPVLERIFQQLESE